jgi:hypothetical protein
LSVETWKVYICAFHISRVERRFMQDYSQIMNARGWASSTAAQSSFKTAEQGYHTRVEAALEAICRPDYPTGMILWLEKADPTLYDNLTRRLPDLISQLWNAHAPLNEFERVVNEWLKAHHCACSLFKRLAN